MSRSTRQRRFNPLPSCEGRLDTLDAAALAELLQSTSLLRGKTLPMAIYEVQVMLQSTSLLRGKTIFIFPAIPVFVLQSTSLLRGKTVSFPFSFSFPDASIHFPLAREDHCVNVTPTPTCMLQSTSLLRGKTEIISLSKIWKNASIHFPLAREDSADYDSYRMDKCFNPLPSCEGRLTALILYPVLIRFNPLPSCEGRLYNAFLLIRAAMLQSTSLLRGKTWPLLSLFSYFPSLQSTSLLRGKTQPHLQLRPGLLLQSTSLLRGKTMFPVN